MILFCTAAGRQAALHNLSAKIVKYSMHSTSTISFSGFSCQVTSERCIFPSQETDDYMCINNPPSFGNETTTEDSGHLFCPTRPSDSDSEAFAWARCDSGCFDELARKQALSLLNVPLMRFACCTRSHRVCRRDGRHVCDVQDRPGELSVSIHLQGSDISQMHEYFAEAAEGSTR